MAAQPERMRRVGVLVAVLPSQWPRMAAWNTSLNPSSLSVPGQAASPLPGSIQRLGTPLSPCHDSALGWVPSPGHRCLQAQLSSFPRLSCTKGQRRIVPVRPLAGPPSPRPPSPPSSWAVVCCPPAWRMRGEGAWGWGGGAFTPRLRVHSSGGAPSSCAYMCSIIKAVHAHHRIVENTRLYSRKYNHL